MGLFSALILQNCKIFRGFVPCLGPHPGFAPPPAHRSWLRGCFLVDIWKRGLSFWKEGIDCTENLREDVQGFQLWAGQGGLAPPPRLKFQYFSLWTPSGPPSIAGPRTMQGPCCLKFTEAPLPNFTRPPSKPPSKMRT